MTAPLFFNPAMEAHLRGQVRSAFADKIPAEHVDVVTDLVFHAARQATDAIDRVCKASGDSRHYIAALGPALSITRGLCENAEAALRQFASNEGLRTTEVRIASDRT